MQLLQNGKQQFIDANGFPLVSGSAGFYAPGTLNPIPTYQDSAGTIANTNPIALDGRGQAIIWGSGTYRQIVKDVTGVTIWDQIVTSSDAEFSGSNGASLIGFDGGTLTSFFLSKNNRVVDSIGALRSLSKLTYTRSWVTGYYAPHDGGGGAYQYDPSDTTSADNNGTIIVATDGGRWKLQVIGRISVKQFGAKGDGTTDDTTTINNAAAVIAGSGGGTLYFPKSIYQISAPITTTAQNVRFVGDGMYCSIVKQVTLTANGFTITQPNCEISDIGVYYPTQATGGSGIQCGTGTSGAVSRTIVQRVNVSNAWNSFVSWGENTSAYADIYASNFGNIGFWFQITSNVTLTAFNLTGSGSINPTAGTGIYLQGNCQGCEISFGESFQSNRTLLLDQSGGFGPEFNKFVAVYFDSGTVEALINKGSSNSFDSCWFSNGRSSTGIPGFAINNGDSNRFTNCEFMNCGGSGAELRGGTNSTFIQCAFMGNSIITPNTSGGLTVDAGVSSFSMIGCTSGNYGDVISGAGQAYGLIIQGGSSDSYQVIGNTFSGNTVAQVSNGGSGVNRVIYGNVGYKTSNSGAVQLNAGSTSVVVSHGLNATPAQSEVLVTPSVDIYAGGAANNRYWVSAVSSTTFTISTAVSSTGSLFFGWQVRTSGA